VFWRRNWGYNIWQLSACSRSLGTLFELSTATIGPRPCYCSIWTFPLKMHYRGEKFGEYRGRDNRILTPNESVLIFRSPTSVQNFISKSNKNCGRRSADRQTDRQKDASDFIICPIYHYQRHCQNKNVPFLKHGLLM